MTVLVQPAEPGQPVRGSLGFYRKLESISSTQQLPLCQLGFDVSSDQTTFVTREEMLLEVRVSLCRPPPTACRPAISRG